MNMVKITIPVAGRFAVVPGMPAGAGRGELE